LLGLVDEEDITSADEAVIARSILKLDPFSERAAEIQMIALFETGGLQPAIAYFETYREHLAEEYEIEPSRKLLGLVDMLRERAARPMGRDARKAEPAAEPAGRDKPHAAGVARPETPTIAVIQVPSAQGGSYVDHIAGAFATELAATLGRFREWSVFRVEVETPDEAEQPDALLRKLSGQGIEFAFFIRPPGDAKSGDFHISCHDSFDRELLVAERFRARPNEWAAVFNNMSARLASHLNVAIATARLHRAKKVSPDQLAAYDFWLDGQKLAIIWQPETEEAAIKCYERAIELAPELPHAYSSLAAVLNSRWIVLPGWENDEADRERALQLAQHALRLDNLDHRCQTNLAWSHLLARRWDCAELHFRLAHDLNPANPSTLIAYALASAFMGSHRQARQLCDRAFDICAIREPYFFGYRATIAFLACDYEDCLRSIEQVPDIFPDIAGWAAASHALLGHKVEAAQCAGRFVANMRERWAGQKPVSDRTLVKWFKTIFPLRRERDRKLLATGMDRAVAWWMETDASATSRSRRRDLSLDM
jgi:tetratricopeptide (TPR) repeat protein